MQSGQTTLESNAAAPKVLSCGVVVLRNTPEGRRYLLLRAWHHWDFPKGRQESNETPFETAIREVREETALTKLDFEWGTDRYIDTPPYANGKVARYYIASTEETNVQLLPNPVCGRVEHEEFDWFDFDHAARLLAPRVRTVLRWAARVSGQP